MVYFSIAGLKLLENTILAGDADGLYQLLGEGVYTSHDLDQAEFLHKAALLGHAECVRVLLEADCRVCLMRF